jgi:hypothetical protein
MSGEIEDRLDHHGRRIQTLEGDVSTLKLDVSKIGLVLDHHADKAEERHGILSTQQTRMMDLLEEREKDARDYRIRREELEEEAKIAHRQWIKSLVNPQTIVIILAILAALFGTRVADIQQVAEILGSPIPQQVLPAQPQPPLPEQPPVQ